MTLDAAPHAPDSSQEAPIEIGWREYQEMNDLWYEKSKEKDGPMYPHEVPEIVEWMNAKGLEFNTIVSIDIDGQTRQMSTHETDFLELDPDESIASGRPRL